MDGSAFEGRPFSLDHFVQPILHCGRFGEEKVKS
jgi:hypothetical protein